MRALGEYFLPQERAFAHYFWFVCVWRSAGPGCETLRGKERRGGGGGEYFLPQEHSMERSMKRSMERSMKRSMARSMEGSMERSTGHSMKRSMGNIDLYRSI